jgi:hypothetical protein
MRQYALLMQQRRLLVHREANPDCLVREMLYTKFGKKKLNAWKKRSYYKKIKNGFSIPLLIPTSDMLILIKAYAQQ